MLATRLGFKPGKAGTRYPTKLIAGLILIAVALAFANHWQWTNYKSEQQARLQATLLRPAQAIKDATLVETAFQSQTSHPQAITTTDAATLLAEGTAQFYDIRESAENAMGTLPGAVHIRFPDFRQSVPVAPGEKVVLFCHNGNRSSETCAELAKMGIDCSFIAGGIEKWIVEGRDFSDTTVKTLSDLRAIPEYAGKNTLLDTNAFRAMINAGDMQIVDTRYPGDFASGHLPGAVNIPIRAMTTQALQDQIKTLAKKPTVAACYDRRSCFMGQVLGLELTQAGIPFAGRYTLPWEFFEPPAPKPHVSEWLADQERTLWQDAIDGLGDALIWVHNRSHFLVGVLALALISRLLVLPIALKSERDQLTMRAAQADLDALKKKLSNDPARKARAVQAFYRDHGLTPMRNMLALAFLPVMMLGVSSVNQAAGSIVEPFLWSKDLGATDPFFVAPVAFTLLAAVYLLWAVAKTRRQAVLWTVLGLPVLFYMVLPLSLAANLYLCVSLSLLLVQRAYVTGVFARIKRPRFARGPKGLVPLGQSDELPQAGNKALRLSQLKEAGLPVPMGVVLRDDFIAEYAKLSDAQKTATAVKVWEKSGSKPVAVRSSASHEDGAEQSFAGVFDSVLDVTADTMRSALDEVIASFHSDRAAAYQSETEGHGNVLVQQMVDAEYAGVLFTQDPMAPGMSLIEWVAGNGETLVSGRVTPSSIRFGRFTGRPAEDVATPMVLDELLALGQRIEALFGTPQDIEWAYANGQFQILQSRDITTLQIGSPAEQVRTAEWGRVLERFKEAEADEVILEQDEMSEVLPRPTPMSFSLMTQLWAPGGSLDQACRELGLPYQLPEGPDAHLVRLFGKTYVDRTLKAKLALNLTGAKSRRLRNALRPTKHRFQTETMVELRRKVATWQALNYSALPLDTLVETIKTLQQEFVHNVYVEAEKINLLAAFSNGEATKEAAGDPALRSYLMQAELPNAPSTLIASCRGTADEAEAKALALMGHRAIFDYELSTPRYSEAPDLLFSMLEPEAPILEPSAAPADLPDHLEDCISMAVAFQDLKEQAKHESLRLVSELRRALRAWGEISGLGDLVFSLTLDEVLEADSTSFEKLRRIAEDRFQSDRMCRDLSPKGTQLTLRDCELLSMGAKSDRADGALGGQCVSGSGTRSGRVFRVEDDTTTGDQAFEGFEPGDIIVCQMVNPAWLPQLQMSGAVLSEVGGWLSHMAIVAREKQIMMLVGCSGLDALQTGDLIEVRDDGAIEASHRDAPETALSA
ncbi:rhodanese-like domain-containing protein [Tritonibacter multivorans]|nr:PEP/pyruvate-binding domain-containing protein [Tritonibacter multivorans]MDA7422392.1 rhodanese-like domain-containing protein [Tritonibacter multivorans]